MKKIIGALVILAVVGSTTYFLYNLLSESGITAPITKNLEIAQKLQQRKLLAGFTLIINGVKRDFSDPKYHNLSEDVYISADNPRVVRVKKRGSTWADFFSTLPMELSDECILTGTGQQFCTNTKSKLKFYVNGRKVNNFLERPILDTDQTLIIYGNETEGEIDIIFQQNIVPQALSPSI